MNEEGTKWFDDLRTFAAECRQRRPLARSDDLSAADRVQYRIIGHSLIYWLEKVGPALLQERAIFGDPDMWEKEPFIVFTSNEAGLIAAGEILSRSQAPIVHLDPEEFKEWTSTHPDEEYRWHVHTWSFFTAALNADTARRANEKYPLAAGETYWLHEEGTMCGPLFGRGGDHLWKWDGSTHTLLEEAFNQWIS